MRKQTFANGVRLTLSELEFTVLFQLVENKILEYEKQKANYEEFTSKGMFEKMIFEAVHDLYFGMRDGDQVDE